MMLPAHNTLVVVTGVAAVGFAAGIVGCLAVLRRRPLVGDAAAHATLVGIATAFLATGRRDLPLLLAGALVSAVAGLAVLVLIRRFTRTRDDAATAIVIGVGFGLGIALLSGITARGVPGSAGLGQFLLGHTAALTSADAAVLAAVSVLAITVVAVVLKETTLVAFDASFAAATGWPVTLLDGLVVGLVALMVVAGLPAAGAVLVTALIVIPPVAARQWTDRVGTMLVLAGGMGLVAAVIGVVLSAAVPRLPTGPLVVLAAAAIFAGSFLFAPGRGWLARRAAERAMARAWTAGLLLEDCLRQSELSADGGFTADDVRSMVPSAADARRAWSALVTDSSVRPLPATAGGGARWKLSAAGEARARERRRRVADWERVLEESGSASGENLTIDLPDPAVDAAVTGRGSAT